MRTPLVGFVLDLAAGALTAMAFVSMVLPSLSVWHSIFNPDGPFAV